MKILVASDSHNHTEILKELCKMYPKMDLYLFAGDSEDVPSSIAPFDSIKGNCDFYDFDMKRFIQLPFGNILIKHYPNITQKELEDTTIFIHGHTHVKELRVEKNKIILCPGSLAYSRDSSLRSYAIIEYKNETISIKIIELDTKKVLFNYINKLKLATETR